MEEPDGAWGALGQLYAYLPRPRRRQFWLVFALTLAGAAVEVGTIGAVLSFLSVLSQPSAPSGPGDPLASATLLVVVAAIAAGSLRLQLVAVTQRFASGVGHDISVEIQRRVLEQPYSWHVGHGSREILASLEKVQLLANGVVLQFVQAMTASVIGSFITIGLFLINPLAALLAATALGLLYLAVSLLTRGRLERHSGAGASAYGERIGIVQESLGGIRDVILDRAQTLYLDAFRRVDLRLSGARAAATFLSAAPRYAIESAGIILFAAAALWLARREGGIAGAMPVLGAFALGAQRLLPLVQQIYQAWSAIAANRGVTTDLLALLRLPAPASGEADDRIAPLPLEDEIRLEGVRFSYPGRPAPALDRIDLTIRRGARVAIVGPTGSGKSTLADVLMGLLEPDEGRVAIDGRVLDRNRRFAWRQSIAHVPQAIFLSDASIERNIAFSCRPDDIDRARVADSARGAHLSEFIESLPDGYATIVGERGVRLSGGQRQRLGIARALYKGAPVLVLDEATSALDDHTEAAVLASLNDLAARGGLTMIVIAHRQSTIAASDIVVRLEDGRIA